MYGTDEFGYRWAERSASEYECLRCGARVTEESAVDCPDCGVPMRNLSVPRSR
jgi:ribosomal protein L37E